MLSNETRGQHLACNNPRVVVSLWDVSDKATAELMKRFYEGMIEKRCLQQPLCAPLKLQWRRMGDGKRPTGPDLYRKASGDKRRSMAIF
jgi:hypothetical protein